MKIFAAAKSKMKLPRNWSMPSRRAKTQWTNNQRFGDKSGSSFPIQSTVNGRSHWTGAEVTSIVLLGQLPPNRLDRADAAVEDVPSGVAVREDSGQAFNDIAIVLVKVSPMLNTQRFETEQYGRASRR